MCVITILDLALISYWTMHYFGLTLMDLIFLFFHLMYSNYVTPHLIHDHKYALYFKKISLDHTTQC